MYVEPQNVNILNKIQLCNECKYMWVQAFHQQGAHDITVATHTLKYTSDTKMSHQWCQMNQKYQ